MLLRNQSNLILQSGFVKTKNKVFILNLLIKFKNMLGLYK